MTSLKYAVFLLIACIVATGECNAEGRECHTCNSLDNPGCDDQHFHPADSTKNHKICTDSSQATVSAFQGHFFNHLNNFPSEQFNNIGDATKEACMKFTLTPHDQSKKVTYRGCSKLGEHACTIIGTVASLVNSTVSHCFTCVDKNYCNDANSLAASLLMAVVALFISFKF